ncbi:MAG: cation:proton antiporter [Campylobacterota bacterium]
MSEVLLFVSNIFLAVGTLFFIAATVGLYRFFDFYTRLHALAKVDNLGLGFIVFGLLLRCDDWLAGAKLLLIWLLAMLSAATLSYLLSGHSYASGETPRLKDDCHDH